MRPARRLLLVAAVTAALVLVPAAAAGAHVTVTSSDAASGGTDATVTFRVPTESDTAATTGLQVQLPTDTPLLGVAVAQIPGWSFTTKTTTLATPVTTDDGPVRTVVSEIDWTATDPAAAIKPGGFGQFPIAVGQLPKTGTLTFKAIQTYSDGSSVDWIETPAPGSTAEPDHPAPALRLSADPAPSDAGTPTARPSAPGGGSPALPTALSIAALVLAAAALALTLLRRLPSR